MKVLRTLFRRFPPNPVGVPVRQVVLDDCEPKVVAHAEEAMHALEAYLSDTSMEQKIEPGSAEVNLISAEQFWRQSRPKSTIRSFAAKLTKAVAGDTNMKRVHWYNNRTRAAQRTRLGYARRHALLFLDENLCRPVVRPLHDYVKTCKIWKLLQK